MERLAHCVLACVNEWRSGCVLRGVPNELSLVERLSLCGARGGEACSPNDTPEQLTRAPVVLTQVFPLTECLGKS